MNVTTPVHERFNSWVEGIPFCDPNRIVVRQPYLAVFVLPNEHFQRKVNPGTSDQRDWRQRHAGFGGSRRVIDLSATAGYDAT
jgi:hypothetical protein